MNITRKSRSPMLNSAGSDTANENSNVRIPLADLTSRSTRPTRNTRTTRSSVGDTKYFVIKSAIANPESNQICSVRVCTHWEKQICKWECNVANHQLYMGILNILCDYSVCDTAIAQCEWTFSIRSHWAKIFFAILKIKLIFIRNEPLCVNVNESLNLFT